jgi:hypothetical protein
MPTLILRRGFQITDSRSRASLYRDGWDKWVTKPPFEGHRFVYFMNEIHRKKPDAEIDSQIGAPIGQSPCCQLRREKLTKEAANLWRPL